MSLRCERVQARRGEVLCAPGERLNALYLIRSGEVELVEGARPHRRVLGPGQFFGELGFGRTRRVKPRWTARALGDASLLRIDGRGLERELQARRGYDGLRLKGLMGCGDRLIFHG